MLAPVFIWNSSYKILGAGYAMYIALPFANQYCRFLDTLTNVDVACVAASFGRKLAVDDGSFGMVDMLVQPL